MRVGGLREGHDDVDAPRLPARLGQESLAVHRPDAPPRVARALRAGDFTPPSAPCGTWRRQKWTPRRFVVTSNFNVVHATGRPSQVTACRHPTSLKVRRKHLLQEHKEHAEGKDVQGDSHNCMVTYKHAAGQPAVAIF